MQPTDSIYTTISRESKTLTTRWKKQLAYFIGGINVREYRPVVDHAAWIETLAVRHSIELKYWNKISLDIKKAWKH